MKNRPLLIIIVIGLFFITLLGLRKLLTFFPISNMKLTSPAFLEGGIIPEKYTCKGDNVSPPLVIEDPPAETKSFALIIEDPDAPFQTWDHWLLWNIAPNTMVIIENATPSGSISGTTSFGNQKYGGPCPPDGRHRYVFKILALNTTLTLPPEARKADLEEIIQGHILGQNKLTGIFP